MPEGEDIENQVGDVEVDSLVKVSSQNSSNRQQMKTMHVMGSKPFSQCGWEKRDPETGAEPGVKELWKTTHMKQEKWSNEMSETIYGLMN
ncbi:hypothetical protein QOZ80_9AG0691960 [Eleusine coracana subsp. coracana]|nr:hypothetical protein QOZ80_9AG0691960 [Eleusine coracana subsp. coracana]